ncbi:hypothetical protein T4D_14623 [Trichinella pseudospiralis]|uniref:Uncharacterized protein n=1 Tax=Trichinella pseudospiralis TaxID=6337 RepID=A0A0V1F6L1_TRIPS|nr:hypothetical protein T4D_12121 [Trichinella pseudospiralis]KRY81564.1 hypothetical protein T4D_14935 [Trichinella pseudospiralis]KRY81566.1 hypothetical protein T4D_12222 [Trichinella pseudospiralis]KRY81617.1 hypothetical protein T4D_14623 [Trichinella pseudospiralis]
MKFAELVLINDEQGFNAVLWISLIVTTVIRQMHNLNYRTIDHQSRYKMLKTAITKKRNFTEMTTIPTMYNPQQVCSASTIPSVVLNIQILLCVIDSCSTFVQDIEKCLRVIWTIFQITEVMHQKDHEKSCSADKWMS